MLPFACSSSGALDALVALEAVNSRWPVFVTFIPQLTLLSWEIIYSVRSVGFVWSITFRRSRLQGTWPDAVAVLTTTYYA